MTRILLVATLVGSALTGLLVPAALVAGFLLPESESLLTGFSSLKPGIGFLAIEGTITESRETVRQLKHLEDNDMVKALLIRVDSPGGAVTPSHEIFSEIRRIRDDGLPVVVSFGTLAASGGYYIACPADLIVSNPGTLTGSIGVIMQFPVVSELMDKLGLDVETIKSREHKDIGSPFRDMTERDRVLLEDVVADVYDQFVEIVVEERGLPEDEVRKYADGRIMTGRQALELGLVDTLGTLEDARRIAGNLAGLKGEPRLIKPRRRLRFTIYDFLESATARILGVPRWPRLSFVWP